MKNIVLFWDDPSTPAEVREIVKEFQKKWGQYEVFLFDDQAAVEFINNEYGKQVADMYKDCRIPAMRSDLFRLMYIYVYGGIWIDIKFLPRRVPPDDIVKYLSDVDMVCCRWFHGRIVNGFFAANSNSYMLESLIDSALKNISNKKDKNIFNLTGPGMWSEVIDGYVEGKDYLVVNHDEIFKKYLSKTKFHLSGRGGGMHWSERQKNEFLFHSDVVTHGEK